MVNLLHHYETQSNRIFLLLEHVSGGQLLKHVHSIRHPSSTKGKQAAKEEPTKREPTIPHNRIVIGGENTDHQTPPTGNQAPPTVSKSTDEGDEDLLLAQLSELDPPSTHPVMASLTSFTSSDSESQGMTDEDSLTRLARIVREDAVMHEEEQQRDKLSELRRQLMESFNENPASDEQDTPTDDNHDDCHSDNLDPGSGNNELTTDDVPVDDHSVPVDDSLVPVNDPAVPVDNPVPVSVEDHSVPVEDHSVPADDPLVPVNDRPLPVGDDTTNDDDTMNDLQQHLMAFISEPITTEEHSVTKDTSDMTNTSKELESGSDDIPAAPDPSTINIIPPTPTTTLPKQLLPAATEDEPSSLQDPNHSIPIKKYLKRAWLQYL